jgi:hypothetical protein
MEWHACCSVWSVECTAYLVERPCWWPILSLRIWRVLHMFYWPTVPWPQVVWRGMDGLNSSYSVNQTVRLIPPGMWQFLSYLHFQPCTRRQHIWATRLRSWLRHCARSPKVAGSIPDGVIGFFHWHNPSGCSLVLMSTQPLTKMNTRNICWGVKAAGA